MGKMKRVSDPLDEKAKARLLGGYVSSGSEHEGGELEGFVDGIFLSYEDNLAGDDSEIDKLELPDVEEGWGFSSSTVAAMVKDLVRPAGEDNFRATLAEHATAAAERLAALRGDRTAFRRAVMASLRDSGYDAGLCKARWESRGGVTGGSYEYIDVMVEQLGGSKGRYVVDVGFGGEFEIARPTEEYERVAAQLPGVYVGKAEELRRLLRVMADAAKKSLQARGMFVPPWRKGKYMNAKWVGPYRRTTSPTPSGSAPPPSRHCRSETREMKCRLVGFNAAPIVEAR